jgi:hypothetical protein
MSDNNEPTVPCEICGKPTRMIGTRRCDRCWELEMRITHDPELAGKIIERHSLWATVEKGAIEHY